MIIKLPSSFTEKSTADVSAALKTALSAESPCVVFDLSEVHEMDTTAMDLLLECASEVIQRDGMLKVAALSAQAATLLELTGMNRLLEAMPDSMDLVPDFAMAQQQEAVPVTEEATLQTSAA